MIWALCVVSLRWLIHAYLFFEKIVVHSPQTPSLQQKVTHTLVSSPTLEIIRVKLLRCIYILREIMCMYICVYATTHTHIYTYIVYFDYCSSLYLPDVIFWKAGDGNPVVLCPLLLIHGAKEDKQQLWALLSLLGRTCIVSLATVSSFSSSFLKGI